MTTEPITDAQLEAIARDDIREVINSHCLDAAIQSEVLFDEFPDEFPGDDTTASEQLIARFDAIVRRIRDEHFPAS